MKMGMNLLSVVCRPQVHKYTNVLVPVFFISSLFLQIKNKNKIKLENLHFVKS